ncbi:hypothetical protein EVAR_99066_1 [Eumeta japonica]|uniref:Uncharacterized protein n=1 Tax=Eumeta variegata TaxID=151549 RepID=A0A4C1SQI6_EUMVA|nr:hypothetical protein EVAR_99066_1 [Eumeta japonica]
MDSSKIKDINSYVKNEYDGTLNYFAETSRYETKNFISSTTCSPQNIDRSSHSCRRVTKRAGWEGQESTHIHPHTGHGKGMRSGRARMRNILTALQALPFHHARFSPRSWRLSESDEIAVREQRAAH